MRRAVVAVPVAVALLLAAGCSGRSDSNGPAGPGGRPSHRTGQPAPSTAGPSTGAPVDPAAPAGLTGAYPCRGGFTCGGLVVPRDRRRPGGPSLTLQVVVETDARAPRGVLVLLNGGPGAAGAPLAPELSDRLGPAVRAAYRLVTLDTRGTGTSAIDCPDLQAEGSTRFVSSPAAVRACAGTLGAARGSYGTDATVADLDRLRVVLGARRLTLMGMSYGTFVAQQYAVAHPAATRALVLDSPLPAGGVDTVQSDVARASRRVLRLACRARGCPGDPVADLALLVRRRGAHGGAELLALVEDVSAVRPSGDTLLPALHAAARGRPADLVALLQAYRTGLGSTPPVFSAGLQVAAFCGDQRFPWGRSDAPERGRPAAVRRAVAAAGDVAPFDAASLRAGPAVSQCLSWPPVPPSRLRLGRPQLPAVPVLFLSGDRDLVTPLESVRPEAARARRGRLVVVRGAGHVVTARPGAGRRAVRRFLLAADLAP